MVYFSTKTVQHCKYIVQEIANSDANIINELLCEN